ncbi:MAG: glycosyltransferase family 1 protein [Chitinophagaceae bacterium]
MIIAVNTRFLIKDKLEGYGYFVHETFRRITEQHPEHQFYFLFDRPYDQSFVFSKNVIPIVVPPQARHPLLWKFWFDVKLPLVLRKIKADVFVSPDGFATLTTKVPQCIVVHDLGFLHHSETYKKSHVLFYKQYTRSFLRKAKAVATVSQFSKKDIIKNYKTPADKINVVYSAAKDIFRPLTTDEKQAIKDQYTEGKEYFIYVGAIQPRKNIINLLKGFSFFKKRQKSNMKLVLAGRVWKGDNFLEQLNAYKYKNDVVLMDYVEESLLTQLVSSAYALVYPSLFEGFGVPPLEAMKCGIPPITSRGTAMEEICGNAALYFDPTIADDIGKKLMLLYKDETLRNKLIENGKSIVTQYSWQRTADLLWESILQCVDKHT